MAREFKFLAGAFGSVRRDSKSNALQHATAGTVAATAGNIGSVFDPNRAGWDFDQSVNNALEKVIWVFRCVDAIATNAAGIKMIGRQGDPYEGKIFDLDSIIDTLLNKRANPYETSEEFRYRMVAQLLLSKRGAFIEIERDQRGNPFALHLLPPHLTEPVPGIVVDDDGNQKPVFVKEYHVSNSSRGDFSVVSAENVIWIKIRPHPQDPYLQMNPLMSAQLAIETDWLSRLYNRNFLLKDGRPALLIALAGEVSPDSAREIKQRLNGGMANVGETLAIEADGISSIDLGGTPHEAQWLQAIEGSKNDILLAFGTPESVLGNASGRTFDNADAEREGWWKDTMVPTCQRIARGLDPLTGSIDDDRYIANDFTKIDVLQRAIKAQHDKAAADFAAGLITLDDYLEVVGKQKLNVAASRVYWHPNGMIIAKDEDDADAASKIPNVNAVIAAGNQQGGGAGDGSGGNTDPTQLAAPNGGPAALQARQQQINAARQGALQGAQEAQRGFNNDFSARVQALLASSKSKKLRKPETKVLEDDDSIIEGVEVIEKAAPYEASRKQLETSVRRALDAWDVASTEFAVARLDFHKTKQYTRHWEGEQPKDFNPDMGFKALDPKKVVQVERWKADLKKAILDAATPAVARELRRVAQEMDSSGVTKVMARRGLGNPQGGSAVARVYGTTQDAEKSVRNALKPLEAIAEKAADRQAQRVMAKIKEMDASGASISEIKAAVDNMIGTRSSWKQGLSEFVSGSAIEGIRADAYSKAGPIVTKTWVTAEDPDVRPTHRKVDQTTKPNNGKFKVGKYLMSHPGDPTAGPEETANCRCWTEFEISDKYADLYDELAA